MIHKILSLIFPNYCLYCDACEAVSQIGLCFTCLELCKEHFILKNNIVLDVQSPLVCVWRYFEKYPSKKYAEFFAELFMTMIPKEVDSVAMGHTKVEKMIAKVIAQKCNRPVIETGLVRLKLCSCILKNQRNYRHTIFCSFNHLSKGPQYQTHLMLVGSA